MIYLLLTALEWLAVFFAVFFGIFGFLVLLFAMLNLGKDKYGEAPNENVKR